MKKINNTLIFLISLLSICFAVKDINIGAYDRLIGSLSIVLILLIPKIIGKIFKLEISNLLELIYIIFIFVAQFLGSVVNLYNIIWWYDLFVHFLSGILTSVLALIMLNAFKLDKNKIFNACFIIIFSIFVAAFWEFIEFSGDTFFNMNVQHSIETGVKDTITDMLIATLGSLIMFIFYLSFKKEKIKQKLIK